MSATISSGSEPSSATMFQCRLAQCTMRDDAAPPDGAAGLGLAVEPGDLANAVHGGSVAERAVGASLVVVSDPVWQ